MNHSAIEISNLRKSFGKQVVLDHVDFKVPVGSVFALLGPNGAGKTTLINILSTLVMPDGGTARVMGHDVVSDRSMVKQSISLTGQFAAVDEVLTGEENLIMIGRLSGLTAVEARTRSSQLLHQFDLTEAAKKRVKTYSGGMRRRLDLAISLVVSRPVIFLDEPTTGLDTMSRHALWDIILRLAKHGMTIFLTTQYLEEADQLADTIAVLANGRITAFGTAQELKARIGEEIIELRNSEGKVIGQHPTNGTIHDISRTIQQLTGSVPPNTQVSIRKPSMEEAFLSLTAQRKVESVS